MALQGRLSVSPSAGPRPAILDRVREYSPRKPPPHRCDLLFEEANKDICLGIHVRCGQIHQSDLKRVLCYWVEKYFLLNLNETKTLINTAPITRVPGTNPRPGFLFHEGIPASHHSPRSLGCIAGQISSVMLQRRSVMLRR